MKSGAVRFILVFCGCFLLATIVCFIGCSPSSLLFFVDRWASDPDWSPDGESIAYTCHYPSLSQVWQQGKDLWYWGAIGGGMEICTIHSDGSHPVRLTRGQVGGAVPVWSPDGYSIAYLSNSGIRIMGEDGSQLMEFTEDLEIWNRKLVWSPDGKALCFSAEDPGERKRYWEKNVNVYIAVPESGRVYRLTNLPGDETNCRWSPDGNRVAFVHFPLGDASLASEEAIIQIANLEGNLETLVTGFAGIGDLRWSPDGRSLAFWAFRSSECVYECTEIYVVNLSDHAVRCLTEGYELDVLFEMAWSPDGSTIAFIASPGPGVYTVDPDGKNLVRVAPAHVHDHGFVWSPDGKWIALARGIEGEKSRIWLVQVEERKVRELETP